MMSPLDRLRSSMDGVYQKYHLDDVYSVVANDFKKITDVDMSENVGRMASHLKQLEKKRDELQRQCTAIETMNRQSEVNRLIDKNKEMKQDIFVLKNLTYRYGSNLMFKLS